MSQCNRQAAVADKFKLFLIIMNNKTGQDKYSRVVVFIDFHIAYDFARNNCRELSLFTGALVIG